MLRSRDIALLTLEWVVEVAVVAQGPPVVVDQVRDQMGFVAFVKADWTGVRRQFWTALSCCRHRYARFETPAVGSSGHTFMGCKERI